MLLIHSKDGQWHTDLAVGNVTHQPDPVGVVTEDLVILEYERCGAGRLLNQFDLNSARMPRL